MASITTRPDGSRWVQFSFRGSRHTLRLGKCPPRYATTIKVWIEKLIHYASGSAPMDEGCIRWLNSIDNDLYNRLARAGLVNQRSVRSVADLADYCLAQATHLKPGTVLIWAKVRKNLLEFFGDRSLHNVSQGDAAEFRQWLSRKYAPCTVSKRVKQARGFFATAVRKEWLIRNPFGELSGWVDANPARTQYIASDVVHKVLDKILSPEWRLILALCRWGGLRCPSEVMVLRWTDVNWETNLMNVRSPKTERHEGKGARFVPIFQELRPFLDDVYDRAPDGATYVIESERKTAQALRSDFLRFLRAAGVDPWPRLFQNLRASRETELADQYPVQVVAAWIGNTPKVALRHYLMVREEHVQRAVSGEAKSEARLAERSTQCQNGEAKSEAQVSQANAK